MIGWNQIWLGIIAIAVAVTAGYIISLIIELKKTINSVNVVLKSIEENLNPVLDELQLTLKGLRNISDDINEVTSDVKVLSKSFKDIGVNINRASSFIGTAASFASIRASGLKAGLKTGLGILISNIFSRIGGRK